MKKLILIISLSLMTLFSFSSSFASNESDEAKNININPGEEPNLPFRTGSDVEANISNYTLGFNKCKDCGSRQNQIDRNKKSNPDVYADKTNPVKNKESAE